LNAHEETLVDYEGTPYLTALSQVCAAIGVFVAVLAMIAIVAGLHKGLGNVWPWVVILAVDIAVNAGLRLQRARRRRALSLGRAERMWRNGVGPPMR
jgi:hypothetical protein